MEGVSCRDFMWSGISTCTTASAVAPSIPRLASMLRGWVGWEDHELEGVGDLLFLR